MNFRTFDLNLLRVFEAVMLEGKLTRAAEVLAMSQPAVSNALARLRDALNDPLFIREGYGVKPSLRALQLWPSIEAALAQLRQTLEPDQSFDPRQCNETITLAMADSTATLLIPALMRKTRQEAPGLSWRVRTLFSRDPRELLASAELDLALGYFPAVEAEAISTQADQSHAADAFRSRRLYEGEYVCVMRPDHPLAGVNLDLERYCAAEHLLVSFSGRPHGFVDEALEAIGRRRRVVLTVNQFFTAGQVVLTTDLLTVLPTHFIASSGMAEKVFSTPLPLKLPSPHVDMLWHHRSEHQAVHRYVRRSFSEIAGRAAR
jgi:DNA-binding transcriptional LysR family regulator